MNQRRWSAITEIEPIDDIVQGWPDWAAWKVRGWAAKCEGFRVFLRDNAAKIRRKFTAAKSPDDKGDVLAELEYASCVVADARFSLYYEPYDSADGRSPDFLVRAGGLQDFHLEVKRIRETEGTREIQRFEHAIIEAARGLDRLWDQRLYSQRLTDRTGTAPARRNVCCGRSMPAGDPRP